MSELLDNVVNKISEIKDSIIGPDSSDDEYVPPPPPMEDDDSDSGAWEPLDSKDKNVHPNEPTTSNGHTTKNNPAPNNNFVSSDEESKGVTAKDTQQEKETPNKAFEEKCLADMVMNGERKWEV